MITAYDGCQCYTCTENRRIADEQSLHRRQVEALERIAQMLEDLSTDQGADKTNGRVRALRTTPF